MQNATAPTPALLPDAVRRFDRAGRLADGETTERRLSDLAGCFVDVVALQAATAAADPVVYTVTSAAPGAGEGDLGYALGVLQPGRVGDEYYFTKGHLHAWRAAAEVYVGLAGTGALLLQDEDGGNARMVTFGANDVVYVPGSTAHRTINTGEEPLVYLGIYPARAGHDYDAIARHGFSQVVVAGPEGPVVRERAQAGTEAG